MSTHALWLRNYLRFPTIFWAEDVIQGAEGKRDFVETQGGKVCSCDEEGVFTGLPFLNGLRAIVLLNENRMLWKRCVTC